MLGKDDREIRDLQISIPPTSNLPVPFTETLCLDVSIKNHGYVKRQTPLWTRWQSFHFTRHLLFIIKYRLLYRTDFSQLFNYLPNSYSEWFEPTEHFVSRCNLIVRVSVVLTLERTREFIPPLWYWKGGDDGTPPESFWYVAVFRNDFAFSGKPLIF